MDASKINQMKEMEDENRRLKRMFADLSMQADLLKEALGKKRPGHLSVARWPPAGYRARAPGSPSQRMQAFARRAMVAPGGALVGPLVLADPNQAFAIDTGYESPAVYAACMNASVCLQASCRIFRSAGLIIRKRNRAVGPAAGRRSPPGRSW